MYCSLWVILMRLEYKDIEKLNSAPPITVDRKHIFDIDKFMYWNNRSEHFSELMTQTKDDKNKFKENFYQAMRCEIEKNKYFKISRKEFLLLLTMLKYHNHINSERKLFMDKNGREVKEHDRRSTI